MSETEERTGQESRRETIEAYVHQRLEDQIDYYERKSARNKKLYFALSAAAIAANAMIPVVSVFLPSATGPKLIITLLSAVAVMMSSFLILFNTRELWGKYRMSAARLQSFRYQYYTRSGMFAGLDDEQAFLKLVEMSEQQLQEENSDWGSMLHNARSSISGKGEL